MDNIITQSFKLIIYIMKFLHWYPPNKSSNLELVKAGVMYLTAVSLTILCAVNFLQEMDYDGLRIELIYIIESTFAPRTEEEENIARNCIRWCKNISVLYVSNVSFAQFLLVFSPLFIKGFDSPLRFPFEETTESIVYIFATILRCTGVCYVGFATSLIDPLVGGLAYHAATQVKILKHRLQNLHVPYYEEEKFPGSVDDTIVRRNIIRCIQHHNAIVSFVDEYENCFSWLIFSQFFGNVGTLCFCCVTFVTLPLASVDAVLVCTVVVAIIIQIFLYCYFGTVLFEENNTLLTAVYMSSWYEYNEENQKMLITFMERSKRPMIVTAGKMISMTIETYTKLLQSSYSFIAVLK